MEVVVLGRVINPESAGKERSQLVKAIVVAMRELASQQAFSQQTRDLLAFIVLSLEAIARTIDLSVAAWEKRGYWVKADRFRMEWHWAGPLAEKLREELAAEDWAAAAGTIAQVSGRLAHVKVSAHHRMGTPWNGAWGKLTLLR
jgi:hypothetical protein